MKYIVKYSVIKDDLHKNTSLIKGAFSKDDGSLDGSSTLYSLQAFKLTNAQDAMQNYLDFIEDSIDLEVRYDLKLCPPRPDLTTKRYTRDTSYSQSLYHNKHMFAWCIRGGSCWDCGFSKEIAIHQTDIRHPLQVVESWELQDWSKTSPKPKIYVRHNDEVYSSPYTRVAEQLSHVQHRFAKLHYNNFITCWDCKYPMESGIHSTNMRHPSQILEEWEVEDYSWKYL